jgi:hypothetical protein
MYTDPVVEEVRKNGAKLTKECEGDVHRMAERLRHAAGKGGRRIVRRGEIVGRPLKPPPRTAN